MNNAISVKALQESKVISDAMQDAGLMGEDNAPKFAAAIAYGFRVKLTEPGVWVSIKKGYKEDDYGARIYILNRAVDGGAVLGESYYMNSAGFESAQSAVEAVSEALKTFDYSFCSQRTKRLPPMPTTLSELPH